MESKRILVLYGSQTNTAQEKAESIWRITKTLGFHGPVLAMDDYPITKLIHEEIVVFVCATTGQGDEPDNMRNTWKFLRRKNLPSNSLIKVRFGVLGLGDSSYQKFNFVAKKLYRRLLQLGAKPMLNAGFCDYQHDLGHDAVMVPWIKDFISKIILYYPDINIEDVNSTFVPRWKVTLVKDTGTFEENVSLKTDIYYSKGYKDQYNDIKYLELKQKVRTTEESHVQDVRLLTFKPVSTETVLDYRPGDIFNLRPRNSRADVEDLFNIFQEHNLNIEPFDRLLLEECHTAVSFA